MGEAIEWRECFDRAGFVQRIVVLSQKGYPYFALNQVPEWRTPEEVDRTILAKYPIYLKKRQRSYRKEEGMENGVYIRHGRSWVLMMTDPSFALNENKKEWVLDMRETEIRVLEYEISLVKDGSKKKAGKHKHVARVALNSEHFTEQRAYFDSLAVHRDAKTLGTERWKISSYHVKYKPIYQQWRAILNRVNTARKKAGFDRVTLNHIRWYAKAPKHFGSPEDAMYEMLSGDEAA